MPDYSTEIAALEAKLNAATSATSVDGLSVTTDLKYAQQRLNELRTLHDGDSETDPVRNRRRRYLPYRNLGGN